MIGLLLTLTVSKASGSEISVNWKWDSIATIGALGAYGAMELQKPRDMSRQASPKGIDAWVHPQWNPAYSDISDFLGHPLKLYGMNLPVLTTIGIGLYTGHQKGVENGLAHGMVVVQAVAINSVITEALKLSISRPRPFTSSTFQSQYPNVYNGEYIQHELTGGDAFQSMPSGHTSTAAATYFSIATLLASQSDQELKKGLLYGTATLLTTATATARVVYGMHHPSDTIVGGLLGAGIGYAIGKMHLGSSEKISVQNTQNGFQMGFSAQW